jgi:hypothetical protein
MSNRTKAQVQASKILSSRNTRVMQFVSQQLQEFDKENPAGRGNKNTPGRDAFAKQVLERAQATIA